MEIEKSNFLKVLSKEATELIPLYCTGYPESGFMKKYIDIYHIRPEINNNLIFNNKDYSIIKKMGFDAISLWDFRRGKGGYRLDNQSRVDGWGRIYKENWYLWDGVLKNERVLENWEQLTLPSRNNIAKLKKLIQKVKGMLVPILSLPGLFEKTWQSMGFLYFSKCLRNDLNFIEKVINFFSDYVKDLIMTLQNAGAEVFLIADDCGYKKHLFIPKILWHKLFFNKYQEIIEIIHKKNQKIIIHSDGDICNIIDIFIELGFDGVQSLEPNAGVDIFSLFKKFSEKICFIGNLDVSTLLTFGTPQQVKNYIIKLITEAKKTNNYLVISPTQQINEKIKPDNIKMMINTTKNFVL